MKKVYNKLVRDKLLDIYEADLVSGKISAYGVRNITGDELVSALSAKLAEELAEVGEALLEDNRDHLTEELADLLEVVEALAAAKDISGAEISACKENKFHKRGGFNEGLFLESIDFN